MRRGSKAGGQSDGQRQRISTVEAADGKGGNSGAGVLSDVIFVNIKIIKNNIAKNCIYLFLLLVVLLDRS